MNTCKLTTNASGLKSWGSRIETHRANRVNLGEGGLRITKTPGGEVEEVVALVSKTVQVSTLVASLMWTVDGESLMLFYIGKPPTQIRFQQISTNEVPYPNSATPHHVKPLGNLAMSISSSHSHQHHVPLTHHLYIFHAAVACCVVLLRIGQDRDSMLEAACRCCHFLFCFALFSKFLTHKRNSDSFWWKGHNEKWNGNWMEGYLQFNRLCVLYGVQMR